MAIPVHRWALGPLTLAVVVLGAGCNDAGSDGAASSTSSSSTTVVLTTTGPSTTASTGTTAPATSTLPPADRQVTTATGFASPTGNIGCYIDLDSVRCDIRQREWQPPPKPADCDVDFGQGIKLTAGGSPEFVCAGDTAQDPRHQPLPYGESIQAGSLRCDSSEAGMSCTDVDTGRGFSMSRLDYSFR